ncbi:MAG: hypothetical protein JW810_12140 [Sedimentisphaerales bacterium]|nr:hypothetical protein [Sedimentisphaerales bacterium]
METNTESHDRQILAAIEPPAGSATLDHDGPDGPAAACLDPAQVGDLSLEQLASMFAAYNETTDRMLGSYQQLQAEVARLREQLRQKNEQLERKNRLAALGEMAAGMAHEIRNPLGGIQLYASLLERDLAGQAEPANWARKISHGVRTLDAIVSDILAFTQDQTCSKSELNVSELVRKVLDYLRPRYAEAQVSVDLDGVAPDLNVQADETMLTRVFLNLLHNAFDALGPSGRVVLKALSWSEQRPYRARIEIADSGGGIPESIREKIFNPFYTTKDTGTGLGLAIVHRLIECHGGIITAANNDMGGASFTILLP